MKSNELRLGNLIENLGDIISVEYLDKSLVKGLYHRVDTYNTSVQLKHCKPILLTEDCLIKLGFRKDKTQISLYYKDDFEIQLPVYFKYKDCNLRKLNYVHELQNLYFALTKNELEIKL